MMNTIQAVEEPDTECGRIVIQMTAAEGKGIQVAVRDTGRSIDAAHLERIFAPFVTTKKTGMGLAISRTIIVPHSLLPHRQGYARQLALSARNLPLKALQGQVVAGGGGRALAR